jgi:hypothetical protein
MNEVGNDGKRTPQLDKVIVDAHFFTKLWQTRKEPIKTICRKPKRRQVTYDVKKAQDRATHNGPRERWVTSRESQSVVRPRSH